MNNENQLSIKIQLGINKKLISISEDNSLDATALDVLSLEMQKLSDRLININRA